VSSAAAVLTVTADAKAPTIALLSPTYAKITNGFNYGSNGIAPNINLFGKITDDGLITNATLNGTPITFTRTAPGTATFAVPVTLQDGSNTFQLTATDSAGNVSKVLTKVYFCVNTQLLTVNIAGTGSGSVVAVGSAANGLATNGGYLINTIKYT